MAFLEGCDTNDINYADNRQRVPSVSRPSHSKDCETETYQNIREAWRLRIVRRDQRWRQYQSGPAGHGGEVGGESHLQGFQ